MNNIISEMTPQTSFKGLLHAVPNHLNNPTWETNDWGKVAIHKAGIQNGKIVYYNKISIIHKHINLINVLCVLLGHGE